MKLTVEQLSEIVRELRVIDLEIEEFRTLPILSRDQDSRTSLLTDRRTSLRQRLVIESL
jgi:hypothetical protein